VGTQAVGNDYGLWSLAGVLLVRPARAKDSEKHPAGAAHRCRSFPAHVLVGCGGQTEHIVPGSTAESDLRTRVHGVDVGRKPGWKNVALPEAVREPPAVRRESIKCPRCGYEKRFILHAYAEQEIRQDEEGRRVWSGPVKFSDVADERTVAYECRRCATFF
jgi:hypothetical protein